MRYLTTISLALIAVISLISCRQNNGIPDYTVDADLKAAFNYLPGTYWIYKDSISGSIDSFAVLQNVFTKGSPNTAVAGNYSDDAITIYVTEYIGGSATDTLPWIIELYSNAGILTLYKSSYNGPVYFQFSPEFYFPFKIGSPGTIGGVTVVDAPYATNILSNYSLNGGSYLNVAEIHNFYSENGVVDYDDWFYVNADIGYIKMRINDNYNSIHKVWELQRWNIIK